MHEEILAYYTIRLVKIIGFEGCVPLHSKVINKTMAIRE